MAEYGPRAGGACGHRSPSETMSRTDSSSSSTSSSSPVALHEHGSLEITGTRAGGESPSDSSSSSSDEGDEGEEREKEEEDEQEGQRGMGYQLAGQKRKMSSSLSPAKAAKLDIKGASYSSMAVRMMEREKEEEDEQEGQRGMGYPLAGQKRKMSSSLSPAKAAKLDIKGASYSSMAVRMMEREKEEEDEQEGQRGMGYPLAGQKRKMSSSLSPAKAAKLDIKGASYSSMAVRVMEREKEEEDEQEGQRGMGYLLAGQKRKISSSLSPAKAAKLDIKEASYSSMAVRVMEREKEEEDEQEGQRGMGYPLAGQKRKMSSSLPATKLDIKGASYSSMAVRMMESMGYKLGEGLGRSGTGITTPIEQSTQLGRRGLGFGLTVLEKEDMKWEEEEVNIHQHIEWLPPSRQMVPNMVELATWMKLGKRKETIEDEVLFCDPDTLRTILERKSEFDHLSDKEFLAARLRSNPYELIKGAIFQNRAAMKMANIDSVTDYMFTEANKRDGRGKEGPMDILYFADICAGPGGFSEYILWRKTWHAKGFGFTLKDPDSGSDFKLDEFLAAPCETFDPHYGVGGYDGDGDITRPDNLSEFRAYVKENSKGGVHFVMGDGGFSVEGQENIQEVLMKQLVLCQYICALSILRVGGHFVCKVFDMFTPFSVGLFYLLYRCFRHVSLFKPVTSRPANSERYVICRDLLPGSEAVHDYLYDVNLKLRQLKDSDQDVLEVVPLSVMQHDEVFLTYIRTFNDSFGINQILHLKKIQYFVRNSTAQDLRQAKIRRECLELWKVPLEPRTSHTPTETATQIFTKYWEQLTSPPQREAEPSCLSSDRFTPVNRQTLEFLRSVHSWKWCWAAGKRMMIVGLGRNRVFGWEMRTEKAVIFSQRSDLAKLELPSGTVLEIEIVSELEGEDSGQRKRDVVYILDVLAIHGKFYGDRPLKERHDFAEKLTKVLNKPCRKGTLLLRAKTYHRVADLCTRGFPQLELKRCKGQSWPVPTVSLGDTSNRFLAPKGMIFLKPIKDPWQLHLGRSGKFYYFNPTNGKSLYDCPSTSVASFLDVLQSRHLWMWDRSVFRNLCSEEEEEEQDEEEEEREGGALTKKVLCSRLRQYLK